MAKILAKGSLEVDGGCDLNHFLVAALHRTIAFVEVDNIAVLVSEDLYFDVLSSLDIAFKENSGVAEGVLGFFLGFGQIWQNKQREAVLLQQLTTDPHTPGQFRPYVVRNIDAWYSSFGVKPDAKFYLKPEDRAHIW